MQKILSKMLSTDEFREYIWKMSKTIMPYVSCTIEHGKYVFFFHSSEMGIANYMFRKKTLFEKKEVELFFRLTKKYYGYRPEQENAMLLDIGGNIGTVSIYAKSKYPNLNVVAFEPSDENVKLFKMNVIANNLENIEIFNMALSNFDGEGKLYKDIKYCTDHILMLDKYQDVSEREIEKVNVMRLDSWCEKHSFPVSRIKYICLDVEGHENAVLEGAEKLLNENIIPIWMEISSEGSKNGSADKLVENVSKYYSYFIDKRRPSAIKNIENLKRLVEEFASTNSHTDVFLIRKGLIDE